MTIPVYRADIAAHYWYNCGKQGTTAHTVVFLPIFRYAKTVQTACWELPQSPEKGEYPLNLLYKKLSESIESTRFTTEFEHGVKRLILHI